MNARNLLLAVALCFGVTETIDIPHTGIPAAAFAVVFFACALWFWRRHSLLAAGVLSAQFLVEVTQAHTWGVALPEEIFAMALGTIGLVAATGVFGGAIDRRRARRIAPRGSVSPAPRS